MESIECPHCHQRVAVTKYGYDRHRKQRYKCSNCKKTFVDTDTKDLHMNKQTPLATVTQIKVLCPHCNSENTKKNGTYAVLSDTRNVPFFVQRYKCNQVGCKRTFDEGKILTPELALKLIDLVFPYVVKDLVIHEIKHTVLERLVDETNLYSNRLYWLCEKTKAKIKTLLDSDCEENDKNEWKPVVEKYIEAQKISERYEEQEKEREEAERQKREIEYNQKIEKQEKLRQKHIEAERRQDERIMKRREERIKRIKESSTKLSDKLGRDIDFNNIGELIRYSPFLALYDL
jgi:transposase-like protein